MKPFYKVKEAATVYGIGRNRLYNAIKTKELRAYKPNCKVLLLKASEIEEWILKYPA
jgi:excisionase family DNA binding protein